MRIVFLGATQLGFTCCKFIIEKKLADIACIFTIPEEFKISYSKTTVKNATFKDFNYFKDKYSIPVVNVTDKMNTYQEDFNKYKPDLILVVGWYYMIPKSIREIAPKGCVGMHGSLLPKYRGGAPLVWAIINDEKETGITLFYLEDGIDEGDIIAQEKIIIEPKDTIKTMIDKMTVCSISLLENYLPLIADGTAQRIKQDSTIATYVPQRQPEDGLIDWNWDAKKIKNFIRAQTKPYPGAFTIINSKKITIWDADIVDMEE